MESTEPASKRRRLDAPSAAPEPGNRPKTLGGRVANVIPFSKSANGCTKVEFRDTADRDLDLLFKGRWAEHLEPYLRPGVEAYFHVDDYAKKITEPPTTPATAKSRLVCEFRRGCRALIGGVPCSFDQTKGHTPIAELLAPTRDRMESSPRTALRPVDDNHATPVGGSVQSSRGSARRSGGSKPSRATVDGFWMPKPLVPYITDESDAENPLPEVTVRQSCEFRDGPVATHALFELQEVATDLFYKKHWAIEKTYFDVIGIVSRWTVSYASATSPARDHVARFDIRSVADRTSIPCAFYFKQSVQPPGFLPNTPIALINARWNWYEGGQLQGPSHKWPYASFVALDGEPFTSSDLGSLRIPEAHLALIMRRLQYLYFAGSFMPRLPDSPRSPVDPFAGVEARPLAAPGAGLVSDKGAAGPSAPGKGPHQSSWKDHPSRGALLKIRTYQPRISFINEAFHGLNCDILVEVRHRKRDLDYLRDGRPKRVLYVSDWTKDDRLIVPWRVAHAAATGTDYQNRNEKTDMELSIVGHRLVKLLDEVLHEGRIPSVVLFRGAFFSHKGPDKAMDCVIFEDKMPLPADTVPFEFVKEDSNLPEYKAFVAHRNKFFCIDDRPDPPDTQRGFEKKCLPVADAAGIPVTSLKEASSMSVDQRARVDVHCTAIKPGLAHCVQLRRLVCGKCTVPRPLRPIISACVVCEHPWDWIKSQPCQCPNAWPTSPAGGFGICDCCDEKIELAYHFGIRVVDAKAKEGGDTAKAVMLGIYGSEAERFIGIPAAHVDRASLEKRLNALMDGSPVLPLIVQAVAVGKNGLIRLRVAGSRIQ